MTEVPFWRPTGKISSARRGACWFLIRVARTECVCVLRSCNRASENWFESVRVSWSWSSLISRRKNDRSSKVSGDQPNFQHVWKSECQQDHHRTIHEDRQQLWELSASGLLLAHDCRGQHGQGVAGSGEEGYAGFETNGSPATSTRSAIWRHRTGSWPTIWTSWRRNGERRRLRWRRCSRRSWTTPGMLWTRRKRRRHDSRSTLLRWRSSWKNWDGSEYFPNYYFSILHYP